MNTMPSKSQPRQNTTSKTVKERALSPRTRRNFRDKTKTDIPIYPTRTNGNCHQDQAGKNGSRKGELVKHMSSLPGFLQQGDKPQDKILNFGVLDWESLEKWKPKQKQSSGQTRSGTSTEANRSEFLPSSKMISCHDFTTIEKCSMDEQQRKSRKDESYIGSTLKKRSHKSKAPDSHQKDYSDMGTSSSKSSTRDKTVQNCNELESDPVHPYHHKNQDSIILLLPKDFSRSGGIDEFQCQSVDGNSEELNWSSFSDVFSIEELHFEELKSDIPHSCPLPSMADTETELDMNLDSLIHDQRMHLPSDQPCLSAHMNHKLSRSFIVDHEGKKEELTSSFTSTTSEGLDLQSIQMSNSNAREPSLARQFSSRIGRLSRSLSFREGSAFPQLKHASIRSGPAQTFNIHDNFTDNAANANGRGIISPFRKLLEPILKPKAPKPVNLVDSQTIPSENSGSNLIKAVLQLTLKSDLPLFKFLVETNNEILASTVKRLSPLRKDDPSWLYSFYSVEEVKKKGSVWRYQGNKGKSSDLSYKVIGQMKVSEPLPCENNDNLEETFTRESVLYGVDLSKVSEETPDSAVNKELGGIVIEMPKNIRGNDHRKNEKIEKKTAKVAVILPSAIHSVPNEGVPASLINRWRSGGMCDCGGWDVGCKLQVLTNQDEDDKLMRTSSGYQLQQHCNLFLQGAGSKENRPVFRLLAHGEGIYLVEYESTLSSLQAFAISVAILSNQKQASFSDANCYSGVRKGHYRSKSSIVQGDGTRYATYPPHSPVSRA